MNKKYQIFISSTYEDLKEERRKVQDTILSMYQFPIGMEMFSAADEEQWEMIKETIDSSDFYVLIIGHRYGSVIENGEYTGISYTQKEFRYALEQKIPVLAFLIDDSVPVTPDKIEQDATKKKKLEQFIEEVKKGRTVQWWKSKDDLANKVMNSLNKQINRGKRPGWIRANILNIEETQKEMLEMNKKIRKLEEENEGLRKLVTVRSPKFKFEINDGEQLRFKYQKIYLNYIRAEFLPLTEENIKGYEIDQSEVEAYNNSLPTNEELEKYLDDYWFYKNMKENAIPFKVRYSNIGSKKANDVHIRVSFSKGILIMDKDKVEKSKEPKKPQTLENPIDKYLNGKIGMRSLTGLYDRLNMGQSWSQLDISVLDSVHSINYSEDIEDNSLIIWDRSLIHTDKGCSEEYYLIPAGKGEYNIKISVICEEFEAEEVDEFQIIVE